MKETIRCCISCILPCGALDVVRIVHTNGRVEEISHPVCAGDITRAHPHHVLRKPPSPASIDDDLTVSAPWRAVILPPSAELRRGQIYFLTPVSEKKSARESRRGELGEDERRKGLVVKQRVLMEKQKERRRGRVGVWRPQLESISEMMMTHD
ncbi:uncharacterized protein LOC110022806 [Phalaenopsis equestris]|uniref:uncharacterized protein LOC110022806 n=1 Tax=Phalaenopsis equestris TaxID=78828 RepID=UPI0009E25A65|nr:uncharacterized protein LOC110022806 [Phalaenopsis equestris]